LTVEKTALAAERGESRCHSTKVGYPRTSLAQKIPKRKSPPAKGMARLIERGRKDKNPPWPLRRETRAFGTVEQGKTLRRRRETQRGSKKPERLSKRWGGVPWNLETERRNYESIQPTPRESGRKEH